MVESPKEWEHVVRASLDDLIRDAVGAWGLEFFEAFAGIQDLVVRYVSEIKCIGWVWNQ